MTGRETVKYVSNQSRLPGVCLEPTALTNQQGGIMCDGTMVQTDVLNEATA
jgi:hypothetical protein